MQDGNYIKLFRKMLEWEWWYSINTTRLFIYFLLKANWCDSKFQGTTVPRGSFVSSIKRLSEETNLTQDEVRTAICNLLKTNEITKQSTNKYTVFTVVNYDMYQEVPKQEHKQSPNKSQPIPKLFPTSKEDKEIKEDNKKHNVQSALALFEQLWKLYPCKKGKGQISERQKIKLLDVGFDEMNRAVERYKTEWKKDKEWRKEQNGSTFFNSGYIDYLDANYVPGKNGKTKQIKSFNQFQQNDYDFETLEKELLKN